MAKLEFLRRYPIALLATIALSILLPISRARGEEQMIPIPGNHSHAVEKMVAPQPAPGDTVLTMSVALNPTNRAELERLIAAQQDPESPEYHKALKRGEFDRRFGPDPAVRTQITRWLTQKGFKIVNPTSDHHSIRFQGTITQAQDAFGIVIYTADGGMHYGNLADPSVPSEFVNAIGFVDGLDNLRGWHTPMRFVPGGPASDAKLSALSSAHKSAAASNRDAGQSQVTIGGVTGFGRMTSTPFTTRRRCWPKKSPALAAVVSV
ncbi:MAG: protease pro-enzyme activation domain-containing protein [Candidatus Binataceae bacterium]